MKIIKNVSILFIITCVFGYACKNNSENINDNYLTEILKFDVSKQTIVENADSIKIKEIIKLDSDPNIPLGRIDKILITNDRIFVLDRTFSKFLFVYGREGNLLYKIGYKGNAPGEYVGSPKDFHVDETLRIVTVFDSDIKTLNMYDWDGNLIDVRLLKKTWPYTFTKFDSLFYYAYKTVDTDSYLLRIEDEKENTFFKYERLKNKRDFVSDECFFNTSQYVYFVKNFNNDVVVLKDKKIEKILSIDFGVNAISKDFLKKYKGNEFIKEASSNKKATNITKIVETDQLFTFQYEFDRLNFQIIYNKNNGNYVNGIYLNNCYFPSQVHTNYENWLVSALSAEYLEFILSLKDDNPDGWDTYINAAHPVISDILLNTKVGQVDDYIFIYNLNI